MPSKTGTPSLRPADAPHSFGEESLGHLTPPAVLALLTENAPREKTDPRKKEGREIIAAAARELIGDLVRAIYCDPARPRNMTCYLPSERHPRVVMVSTPHGWVKDSLGEVMRGMRRTCARVLHEVPPEFDETARAYETRRYTHTAAILLLDRDLKFISENDARGPLLRNAGLLAALGLLPKTAKGGARVAAPASSAATRRAPSPGAASTAAPDSVADGLEARDFDVDDEDEEPALEPVAEESDDERPQPSAKMEALFDVEGEDHEEEAPRATPVAPGYLVDNEPKYSAAEQRILAEEHALLEVRHA